MGEPEPLSFGFSALRYILKDCNVGKIALIIIDRRSPNFDRYNLVSLVDFHIINSGTFTI